MSDDCIVVTPSDPCLIPADEVQGRVLKVLREISPQAEDMKTVLTDRIYFFDCGENFEMVACRHCQTVLDLDWWSKRMDADCTDGAFRLESFSLPCCGRQANLNQLLYDWPQAFGRFSWKVTNPGVGVLDEQQERAIREAAVDPVTIIRQHI